MGNCLRHEGSSSECDLAMEGRRPISWNKNLTEKKSICLQLFGSSTGDVAKKSSSATITGLKIKITKEQLVQLLSKMENHDLLGHQALGQLIRAAGDDEYKNKLHRPWRPALQSIPEYA